MMNRNRVYAQLTVILAAGLGANVAHAATPTYSLEAAAINMVPLPAGRSDMIIVAPGDVITAKMYLRDFSPDGERLRAYQAELDLTSFSSGSAGTIKPVDFDVAKKEERENKENAFIDEADPMWVHGGLHTIPLTDTRKAPGYRWLTVLLDPKEAPVHPQDGTKFYCGSVHLQVSPDAEGEFTLSFVKDTTVTGLLDEDNKQIAPIDYESLRIEVRSGVVRLNLTLVDPPEGAIDARQRRKGRASGWTRLVFTADTGASTVPAFDFSVSDGTDAPTVVGGVKINGTRITVKLSGAISEGRWTNITYRPNGQRFRLGHLAGDVNNDGSADSADLFALVSAMSARTNLPTYSTDINADGKTTAADISALIDLVAPGSQRPATSTRIR